MKLCYQAATPDVAIADSVTAYHATIKISRLAVMVPSDELVILPGHGLSLFVCFHHLSSLS